eukprot:5978-Prymnesium_polylepis.1
MLVQPRATARHFARGKLFISAKLSAVTVKCLAGGATHPGGGVSRRDAGRGRERPRGATSETRAEPRPRLPSASPHREESC